MKKYIAITDFMVKGEMGVNILVYKNDILVRMKAEKDNKEITYNINGGAYFIKEKDSIKNDWDGLFKIKIREIDNYLKEQTNNFDNNFSE
jgi:hypothetical protein